MNFNKTKFTVDEFLALPVFETTREAPTGIPFLLEGRLSGQKEYLNNLIKEHTLEGLAKMLKESKTQKNLRVQFWSKYKDGNIKDCGATLVFPEKGIALKGDTLVINTGV